MLAIMVVAVSAYLHASCPAPGLQADRQAANPVFTSPWLRGLRVVYSARLCLHLPWGRHDTELPLQDIWELNELIEAKHLAQCLAHRKCLRNADSSSSWYEHCIWVRNTVAQRCWASWSRSHSKSARTSHSMSPGPCESMSSKKADWESSFFLPQHEIS